MGKLIDILDDFISLVYPHCCAACGKSLYKHEDCICTLCQVSLPKTGFHNEPNNKVEEKFWGRVEIARATSFFTFSKGGKVQKLIHALKYKGHKEVGVTLGKWYGLELVQNTDFSNVDCIIPVPLHKNKLRSRGYNQTACFAEGLAESMKKEAINNNLYRAMANTTQTRKSRYERWENVEGIFAVKNPEELEGRHILLVDDVVSTGSTLEACIHALQKTSNITISIATIAVS